MSELNLHVRYFQDSTPSDVPCIESNFTRREIEMRLPVESAALILVDLWNIHFIKSWLERAKSITRKFVVPAIEAAREAGLAIIHAPCPEVARQFPENRPDVPQKPEMPTTTPHWPPSEFRGRKGEYKKYVGPRSQPPGIGIHWNELQGQLAISPAVNVLPGEPVIADAHELQHVLADRKALHLIYAGFATNWCLLGRDYGIRSIARYGYNIIVLRDATTGVEFPDTVDDCMVTEISIREIEQQFGFSASNQDFIAACSATAHPNATE